jgi:hypothetical protein
MLRANSSKQSRGGQSVPHIAALGRTPKRAMRVLQRVSRLEKPKVTVDTQSTLTAADKKNTIRG